MFNFIANINTLLLENCDHNYSENLTHNICVQIKSVESSGEKYGLKKAKSKLLNKISTFADSWEFYKPGTLRYKIGEKSYTFCIEDLEIELSIANIPIQAELSIPKNVKAGTKIKVVNNKKTNLIKNDVHVIDKIIKKSNYFNNTIVKVKLDKKGVEKFYHYPMKHFKILENLNVYVDNYDTPVKIIAKSQTKSDSALPNISDGPSPSDESMPNLLELFRSYRLPELLPSLLTLSVQGNSFSILYPHGTYTVMHLPGTAHIIRVTRSGRHAIQQLDYDISRPISNIIRDTHVATNIEPYTNIKELIKNMFSSTLSLDAPTADHSINIASFYALLYRNVPLV